MAKIKGFAIRGLFRYLKENAPGRTAEIVKTLPPESAAVLERPVIASSMYPYRVFADLLRSIDRHLGRGDLKLCQTVGDYAAQQDISGMFKVMLSVFSPKTTLERSNLFWSKYCDTGKLSVVKADPKDALMRMEDFPDIDEAHCYLMSGWIRRFATMTGGKNVVVKHDRCVHHGAPQCEWHGEWS
jgi:predicted hydrocarbon binding protein